MARGKHASDDAFEFDFKPFFIIIIVIAIIGALGFTIIKFIIPKISELNNKKEEVEIVEEEKEENLSQIEGYDILGKISIPKINIEQYILDSYEENALKVGVGKLYGEFLNDYGNFCIAGHNYENFFKDLSELEKGDEIIVTDINDNKITYEIKDIFTVEPTNLECLISNDEVIEITLITCENGANTRLVVKAEMKE